MRYDAVVQLIAVTYTTDAIGQQVAHQTPRTVYANEFVVGKDPGGNRIVFSQGRL